MPIMLEDVNRDKPVYRCVVLISSKVFCALTWKEGFSWWAVAFSSAKASNMTSLVKGWHLPAQPLFHRAVTLLTRCACLHEQVWKHPSAFDAFLSPHSSCRSRLLSDRPVNRVLLDPSQRQALWHLPCPGFSQGCSAGQGHVGGGRIHLQLQLLPDDPQVSYCGNDCSTGALSTLAPVTTEIHSKVQTWPVPRKLVNSCLKLELKHWERILSEFSFGPPFVPVCDGVLLHGPLLFWLFYVFYNISIDIGQT